MQRMSQRLFPLLAGFLGLACAWFAIDALRTGKPIADGYVVVMIAGTLLFGSAALAVHFRWKGRQLLAFLCGVPLCLYALSVIFMGWEDVGGAAIALPLAAVTSFVGVMGFVLSSKESQSDRAT